MKSKFLPIGTVCDIKLSNKKIMIIGYCVSEFNGKLNMKDYAGCAFPEGLLLPNQILSFNHSDITNVYFVGYKNDEQERLDNLLNKYNGDAVEKAKEFHQENDMYLTSNKTYSKILFDENGVVMLAEPKPKTKFEFDSDGYVVNVEQEEVKNPFYNENTHVPVNPVEKDHSKWSIFSKIEFDENGTVVEAKTTTFKDDALNKIEFDENGVVINDGTKKIEQTKKYSFDENGVLISENSYSFDEDGVLISSDSNSYEKEEEIPPIGPGLPGYVEPKNKKTSNYRFDENGNVVTEEMYEFDANGNLVSINNYEKEEEIPPIGPGLPGYEKEEEIPPIGPGLPGYVEPKKIDEEFLDYNSELEESAMLNVYKFDENEF